ncbi:MAG TPA: CmcI family methyltransferase [Verrucomicrobiae bacterium]|jgi:cephalosporin hydroxylase|nr:CmcI family methyltransferase [Verrucomicrobiae bacterium]
MASLKRSLKKIFAPRPPDEPEVFRRVRECLKAGQGADGLKLILAAEASVKALPEWHHLHGLCLNLVGRHEEALRALGAAVDADPNQTAARTLRDHLACVLADPVAAKIPTHQRSWGTSLPRSTLLGMQQALHNYKYRGVPMLKNPFDISIYPLLLWQLKPRTLIEIGSKSGGSALWLGDMMDNFSIDGHIYSVDIVRVDTVSHPRVTFMEGNGRRLETALSESFLRDLPRPWLVIEDADHAYETSSAALKFFHPWLRVGEYIVIEDGIISDLDNDPQFNSGPHRALKEFLGQHSQQYEIDGAYCDCFGYNLTWCTNGFLKKIQ